MCSTKRRNYNKKENTGIQKTKALTQEKSDGNPQDDKSDIMTGAWKT